LALGDAIRIGEGEQAPNLIEVLVPVRTSGSQKLSLPEVGGARDSPASRTIDGFTGCVIVLSAQDIHTDPQIGIPLTEGASENISFTEQGGKCAGKVAEL
jgi:hypothetical protein